MFKINFTKLVQWLIPTWLRQANIVLFLLAANCALRETYNTFVIYRDSVNYQLAHNGQVCYLQAMLNDFFDAEERRISVVDFTAYGTTFFWEETDIPHLVNMGDDHIIFFFADDVGVDFTVQLPSAVVWDIPTLAYLKAKVNEYKLAGKVYDIELV